MSIIDRILGRPSPRERFDTLIQQYQDQETARRGAFGRWEWLVKDAMKAINEACGKGQAVSHIVINDGDLKALQQEGALFPGNDPFRSDLAVRLFGVQLTASPLVAKGQYIIVKEWPLFVTHPEMQKR